MESPRPATVVPSARRAKRSSPRSAFLEGLAPVAWAASFVLIGCGGTGASSNFQPGPTDAGPLPSEDASLLPGDSGSLLNDANEPACPPAPVPSFTPTWKPPSAAKSGACTTVQISTFFDACLGTSSNASGCAAYTQANASCTSCLQSDDTASSYGPVIWHSNRTYYTTNIAGCIADEEPDAGVGGVRPFLSGRRPMQRGGVQHLLERSESGLQPLRHVRKPGGHRVRELREDAHDRVRNHAQGSDQPDRGLPSPVG